MLEDEEEEEECRYASSNGDGDSRLRGDAEEILTEGLINAIARVEGRNALRMNKPIVNVCQSNSNYIRSSIECSLSKKKKRE